MVFRALILIAVVVTSCASRRAAIVPAKYYGRADSTMQTAMGRNRPGSTSTVNIPKGNRYYVGYNTWNEVHVGRQFHINSPNKIIAELGYQFALSRNATYSPYINPILTTNANGFRLRAGISVPQEAGKYVLVQLEYQDLHSNNFVSYESGSSKSTYSEFTELYKKYGLKVSNGAPIFKSHLLFVYYYFGLYYMTIHRTYSVEGFVNAKRPSTREESFNRPNLQVGLGLRVFIF